ncbi:MAG: hypothetical protein WBD40_10575 [Tepidisphaeraceae bacterium]
MANEPISHALDEIGESLRRQPSVRGEVMRRVTEATASGAASQAHRRTLRWRTIGKLAALAACVAIVVALFNIRGGPGATEAFAAAIAKVEAAGTFACRQIVTRVVDGEEEVTESSYASQEPHLERIEYGEGMPSPGEFTVTDYGKQLRLVARPEEKIASLQDISSMYAIDQKSGELKPTQLGSHARNAVLRISAQAVKDLGMAQLDGRDVWVLQSEGGAEPVKTVYVNPADGKPVRVEIAWPSSKQTFTYADIQLDVPLDERLFSLDAPEGYAMHGGHEGPVKPVDEMNGKMLTKARDLAMQCIIYASNHDNRWPETFDDLRAAGMDAQKLRTILAAPDSKDGKPVLLYRKPNGDAKKAVIVVYEAQEFRRGAGVVCGFSDAHAELVPHKEFEKMIKQ